MHRSGDGEETQVGEGISVLTDSKTRTFGSCATENGTGDWGIESQELARRDGDADWLSGHLGYNPELSWTVAEAEGANGFRVAARGDIVADADASISIAAVGDVAPLDASCLLDRATVCRLF